MKAIYFDNNHLNHFKKKFLIQSTRILSSLSPKLGIIFAGYFIANPQSIRKWRFKKLTPSRHITVKTRMGKIYAYVFDNEGPVILLEHGWADTSKRFEYMIDSMLKAGYTVICFDQIGHGKSDGNIAHIYGFIEAQDAVIKHIEDIEQKEILGIVAHSMGAFAALNSNALKGSSIKSVLISTPTNFFDSLSGTLENFGFSKDLFKGYLNHQARKYQKDWQSFIHLKNIHKPNNDVLFIHDKSDRLSSFENCKKFVNQTHSKIIETERLGHHRILNSERVVSEILKYLNPQSNNN